MERITIAGVEPDALGDGIERRRLSAPLGTTDVAINRYRIPPGEGLPAGLHAHADQEEVFLVREGAATFETLDGEVAVEAGEAIRFAPGEFQSGRNGDTGRDLVVLALGAPRDSDDVRLPTPCSECDHESVRLETDRVPPAFVCPSCGATRIPRPCPGCDGDDLRMVLGDAGEPVAVCRACGATFDEPPVREPG